MADVKKIATRQAYSEFLVDEGAKRPELVVMSADLSGSNKTDAFEKAYPERFVEAGISEQDMYAMATGLAHSGKVVCASTFAMFATGRAFEVAQLNDYRGPFKQVSLKNMLRLIHKTYSGIEKYEDIYKFKDVINDPDFKILPHHKWYDSLEKQGVLFLNTSFTTVIDKPMSHAELWLPFTVKLLNYIGEINPEITYFLWGSNAQKYLPHINGKTISSRHPMMCSSKYVDDFLKSDCFKETMNEINWLG